MSVRVRLGLLLAVVVIVTLVGAGYLTRQAVIAPFAKEVLRNYLEQCLYVVDELEGGADPDELGHRLELDVHLTLRPPKFVRQIRRRHRNAGPCQSRMVRGRRIFFCRHPRTPVAIRIPGEWVVIKKDLDIGAPDRRTNLVLLILAAVVVGLASWAAVLVTRPLRTTVNAMEHMAAGDLSHRLPEAGGKELAEVARAFNAMADRIDLMLRAERELMAGISHELRTPLARLRLELELMRDRDVPEKRIVAMEGDLSEVDRLIGELLELSRLSIGERQLAQEPVNLTDIAQDAIDRTRLDKHPVHLEGTGAPVHGDRIRLVRVVTNLLQNAGKYAPAGTAIEVRVDGPSLEVRDHGPGLPEADLQKIFEPFYRGTKNPTGAATGLGLGLMIARQVVELHGGQIEAQNADDGGLIIRFTLKADATSR